eukprot:TRINITY_DN14344_c0_g1_i1.p1 TRINITY_DN14344_c0_g1~~TRINITY_DN14344_c0_g1_i1.p1  ORF type:complete len:375 (+),score=149.89 TRINITY_DN14344_c0_g1_i1:922-2046(+)
MNFKTVISKLQKFAPLRLAEKWDNVGLLIEPTVPRDVSRILLTIDLTEKVLDEAIFSNSSFVLAYHPAIFQPLKRLTSATAKERCVVRAIENTIAVYCPHTAIDTMAGGVNDWLVSGLGKGVVKPVQQHYYADPQQNSKVIVFVPEANVDAMRQELSSVCGFIGNYSSCSFTLAGTGSFIGNDASNPVVGQKGALEKVPEVRLEMVCSKSKLPEVARIIRQVHPYETPAWEVVALEPLPVDGTGQCRLITLDEKVSLAVMVERVKKHLGLQRLRLAVATASPNADSALVQTVAVCAGAGGEALAGVKADVYLTGEMRHHEVLAAVQNGTSVILVEHTNAERGYLKVLQKQLDELFAGEIDIQIAEHDADPLVVV